MAIKPNRWVYNFIFLLLYSVPAASQTESRIQQIQVQEYDRFWRLSFHLSRNVEYQLQDLTDENRVILSIPATLDSAATLPPPLALNVHTTSGDGQSRFSISLPQSFKFDHFYFPPGRKIVLDFYPIFEFESAVQSYEMAGRALSRGDTLRAEQLYRSAILQNPGLSNAYLRLGQIYYWRRDTSAARAAFQRLVHDARPDLAARAQAYLDSLSQQKPAAPTFIAQADTTAQAAMDTVAIAAAADTVTGSVNEAQSDSIGAAAATAKAAPRPIIVARRKLPRPWYAQIFDGLARIPAKAVLVVAALMALAGVFFWLLAMRPRRLPRNQGREAKRIKRLLKLIEKGKHRRIPGINDTRTASEKGEQARVDLIDESEATPFAMDSAPSPRMTRLRRLVDEAVLPERPVPHTAGRESRTRRMAASTPPAGDDRRQELKNAASSKRQVLQLALQGKSVTQIARELDMGVGEVELILGFGRNMLTTPRDEDTSLDFGI